MIAVLLATNTIDSTSRLTHLPDGLSYHTMAPLSAFSVADRLIIGHTMYVCANIYRAVSMYACHIAKSMDQPGKVANPARGQLNRKNEHLPVPFRA